MASVTSADILDLLRKERDDDLVGLEESQRFDAKGAPYRLTLDEAKWELAKDVSAMANARGGLILIAARTEKAEAYLEEKVSKVVPVPAGMVDIARYHDTIAAWTFPSLASRVQPHLFPRPDGRILLALEIEALPADEQPAMVKTVSLVGDKSLPIWAIARRVGSGTEWIDAPQVWADIRDGRLARRNVTLHPGGRVAESNEDRALAAAQRLLAVAAAEGQAVLGYVALPPTPGRLEPFYSDDGIRGILQSLPRRSLRPSGFGLGYGADVRSIGNSLADIEEGRRGLMVDPDGTTVAVALANRDFLGWADRGGIPPNLLANRPNVRLNPYVLAEFSLEFAQFVRDIPMEQLGAGGWNLAVIGIRLTEGDPTPYLPANVNPLSFHAHTAQVDSASAVFRASGDPPKDAFELLRRFVEWFGVSSRDVIFATDGRIEPSTIQSWTV